MESVGSSRNMTSDKDGYHKRPMHDDLCLNEDFDDAFID